MTSDKDIYISANLVIKQHGDRALDHCMIMMARMEEAVDIEGGMVWGRIMGVIMELQKIGPGTVN